MQDSKLPGPGDEADIDGTGMALVKVQWRNNDRDFAIGVPEGGNIRRSRGRPSALGKRQRIIERCREIADLSYVQRKRQAFDCPEVVVRCRKILPELPPSLPLIESYGLVGQVLGVLVEGRDAKSGRVITQDLPEADLILRGLLRLDVPGIYTPMILITKPSIDYYADR